MNIKGGDAFWNSAIPGGGSLEYRTKRNYKLETKLRSWELPPSGKNKSISCHPLETKLRSWELPTSIEKNCCYGRDYGCYGGVSLATESLSSWNLVCMHVKGYLVMW